MLLILVITVIIRIAVALCCLFHFHFQTQGLVVILKLPNYCLVIQGVFIDALCHHKRQAAKMQNAFPLCISRMVHSSNNGGGFQVGKHNTAYGK